MGPEGRGLACQGKDDNRLHLRGPRPARGAGVRMGRGRAPGHQMCTFAPSQTPVSTRQTGAPVGSLPHGPSAQNVLHGKHALHRPGVDLRLEEEARVNAALGVNSATTHVVFELELDGTVG